MARRDSLEAGVVAAGSGLEAYRAALPGFEAVRDSMLAQLGGLQARRLVSCPAAQRTPCASARRNE